MLISHLSEDYTVSFQDISAHPTPRKLAAFLESKKDAALPPMDREDYPLTKTQLGIYLESMTGGSKETYTCSYLAQAAPEVTAEQLIRAARALIAAHPGMKYIIRAGADGMPRMVMTPDADIDVPVFDGTEENRLDFMKTFMPVVPMMDSVLLHLAVYRTPVRCYFAIKSHLIFFDGTAISQFIAEMNRALAGKPLAGEACTIQQAAMIEERQLEDGTHEKAKDYYLNLFKDAEDVPALPGDLNGPLTPGVSENMRYEPGTLTAERVKAFCEKQHISESSFFMGAMALMLGKYLNSQHVSFSTVYNGRPLSEMSHTMGTLIKRIPVYGDLRKDQPVGDFLRGVSKQIFTTMANDIFSFDEVLKTCPVNEDVEFIYQGDMFTDNMGTVDERPQCGMKRGEGPMSNRARQAEAKPRDNCEMRAAGESLLQGDKWFMEHYHTGMVTGCMSIQFFSTAGLYNMTIEYRNEKFTEKWVRRFAQDLFTTAEQLLTASSIGQVSLLTEAEERAAEGSTKKDHAWFTERYGDQEDDWCSIPAPDHESTNINQAGRMRRLSFDAEQVAAAEEYWGVSHSVIAISAGIMALSRFTGKKHVMINWIFNNRLASEAENTVGMLIRNLPAAIRMEEVSSVRELLHSVKEQVAEGIAHASWDFMSETRQAYVNDCMEVNLQLGINGDEMDALPHELIELKDEFSAAGARLELELLENEFSDGGFDSEMEYAEGLFDKERIEAFHDLYIEILERIILGRDEIL